MCSNRKVNSVLCLLIPSAIHGTPRLKQAVHVSLVVQISFMCCGPSVDGQFTRGRADSPNS